MHTEILLEVKRLALAEPKRITMHLGLKVKGKSTDVCEEEYSACGTVGCIAGWTLVVNDIRNRANGEMTPKAIHDSAMSLPNSWATIQSLAIEILGITHEHAEALFHEENWPSDLEERIDMTRPNTPEHAQCVAAAIDRFIADPDAFVEEGMGSARYKALTVLKEFVTDCEQAYETTFDLKAEWYDLAVTYEKAVQVLRDAGWRP